MYLTLSQSVILAKGISKSEIRNPKFDIVLCPSFVALEEVGKVLHKTGIKLGAQDVEPERRGAYTGEVGLDDLSEIGVQYVLLGHSERRQKFGETDALINKKLRAVLSSGMRPILCVGEPTRTPTIFSHPSLILPSGRGGNTIGQKAAQRYVARQVREGLRGVSKKDLKRVVIAYEPIWAIGTGRADTPEDASEMHEWIRKIAGDVSIIYGGSVNSNNAALFLAAKGIDGLLIGRASTAAKEFEKIVADI